MNDYLPFIISGLVIGSVYLIAALGLVVTYRTSGLFNFAHGAVGMAVAFAFFQLRSEWGWPTWLAVLGSLGVFAPLLGFVIDRLLFRSLATASQATKVVVTMGLLITLQGAVLAQYGGETRQVEPFLPSGDFKVGSTYVGYDQVTVVAIALLVLAGLTIFFRRSRTGIVMRAIVDDPALAEGAGFPAARISTLTWVLGSMLAGLAGILFTPLLGLDSIILTLLVVQAYAAAVFGRLVSIPRTALAALVLGLANTLVLRLLQDYPELLNGLRPSLPFLFLFGVLVVAGPRTLTELGQSAPWAGSVGAARSWRPTIVCAVLLPLGALLIPDARLLLLGVTLATACAFVSITALTGSSGLISLTQAGLMGAGAFVYVHLLDVSVPFPLAMLGAGIAVVPLGLAIAIPSLRLPALFLALATFGMGQLIDGLLFGSWHWFSGAETGVRAVRPSLLEGNRAVVVFIAIVAVAFIAAVTALQRSQLGRRLQALRDSAIGTQSLGLNPLWPKVAVFSVSSSMAGVAGSLYVLLLQVASRSAFNTFQSLLWVTIVVVGGIESPIGALVGAFLYYFVPGVLSSGTPSPWLTPVFGMAAIALARRPGGLIGIARGWSPGRLISVPRPAPAPTLDAVEAAT